MAVQRYMVECSEFCFILRSQGSISWSLENGLIEVKEEGMDGVFRGLAGLFRGISRGRSPRKILGDISDFYQILMFEEAN